MKVNKKKTSKAISIALAMTCVALLPTPAFASVESSLMAVQSKLINVILPLAGILGVVFAGLSFVAGHENARSRLLLAIGGAVVGFMAPSIIDFIRGMVN